MSPVGAGKCGRQHQSHRHHQHRKLRQFWVDHDDWSAAGRSETGNPLRQNALDPGFHGVRMVRRMGTVVLMVPAWPESGFLGHAARLRPTTRGGREVNAGFSVGKGEQKVEMTFGDFWPRCRPARCWQASSTPPGGEVYVPHPHGGIVGPASGRR
jgi:hypothetical protein